MYFNKIYKAHIKILGQKHSFKSDKRTENWATSFSLAFFEVNEEANYSAMDTTDLNLPSKHSWYLLRNFDVDFSMLFWRPIKTVEISMSNRRRKWKISTLFRRASKYIFQRLFNVDSTSIEITRWVRTESDHELTWKLNGLSRKSNDKQNYHVIHVYTRYVVLPWLRNFKIFSSFRDKGMLPQEFECLSRPCNKRKWNTMLR